MFIFHFGVSLNRFPRYEQHVISVTQQLRWERKEGNKRIMARVNLISAAQKEMKGDGVSVEELLFPLRCEHSVRLEKIQPCVKSFFLFIQNISKQKPLTTYCQCLYPRLIGLQLAKLSGTNESIKLKSVRIKSVALKLRRTKTD